MEGDDCYNGGDEQGGDAQVWRCKRRRRSLPIARSPNISDVLIVEALSQALTARSECYIALVRLCCFWMQLVVTHPED